MIISTDGGMYSTKEKQMCEKTMWFFFFSYSGQHIHYPLLLQITEIIIRHFAKLNHWCIFFSFKKTHVMTDAVQDE